MITLGSVVLSPDMVWSDRYKHLPVGQTVKQTLAGTSVIFTSSISNGRVITLEARDDMGWLTKQQVLDLTTLASSPGSVYTFDYHGEETHQVVFRQNEPPAVEFQPLVDGQGPSDYFTGIIKLLTI